MNSFLPTIDLCPDHWEIVREALCRHVPDYHVVAFGSRATWTAKDYSDLDLAILSDDPLPVSKLSALREDLDESTLPFRVDIIDFAIVEEGFRSIIKKHWVPIQNPASNKISKIDVSHTDFEIVQDLIKKHLPNTSAWVFQDKSKEGTESVLNVTVFSDPEQKQQVEKLRRSFQDCVLHCEVKLLSSIDHLQKFNTGVFQ